MELITRSNDVLNENFGELIFHDNGVQGNQKLILIPKVLVVWWKWLADVQGISIWGWILEGGFICGGVVGLQSGCEQRVRNEIESAWR